MSRALVLVPTHDHEDTLYESIEAVRRQTVRDWELVALLDGSPPGTRRILEHFVRMDRRISFVEQPKGPRLGEAYRDAIIRGSNAEIVVHATDDDLWFPLHLQTLTDLLEDADFAHAALVQVTKSGAVIGHPASWGSAKTRQATLEHRFNCTGPHQCGYRREAYLRLDRGWETTPPQCPWTDAYMWSKFLTNPTIRRATKLIPTSLKLGVAGREDWSPRRRRQEMAEWACLANAPGFPEKIALQIDYCTYYRWSVGVCNALEGSLSDSLDALGVQPVLDVPVAELNAARNHERAMLRVTPEQMRALEQAWNFLSQRMPAEAIRPYLLRAVELDPADDTALRQLVDCMIADGEGAGALRLAIDLAEETALKGRRWEWISKLATALGETGVASYARQRAQSPVGRGRRIAPDAVRKFKENGHP